MLSVTHITVFLLVIFDISHAVVAATNIEEKYIEYYYYSPNYEESPIKLDRTSNFSSVAFDVKTPLKVLCHGYTDNSSSYWIPTTAINYINTGVNNIIAIDWGRYSNVSLFEILSASKTIGDIIGKDLIQMSKQQKILLSDFHLSGHSLGAHIVGFAGKTIIKSAKIIGRITGLDPGSIFMGQPPINRLASTDASFVDIIHTYILAGFSVPLGIADFWPNGGLLQPNCSLTSGCNHMRAAELFANSIVSKEYVSWRCINEIDFNAGKCRNNSQTLMGEQVDLNATGNYFLNTNPSAIYVCAC